MPFSKNGPLFTFWLGCTESIEQKGQNWQEYWVVQSMNMVCFSVNIGLLLFHWSDSATWSFLTLNWQEDQGLIFPVFSCRRQGIDRHYTIQNYDLILWPWSLPDRGEKKNKTPFISTPLIYVLEDSKLNWQKTLRQVKMQIFIYVHRSLEENVT